MIITFSPTRSDAQLNLSKTGDVITINGEAFDFSMLPDGALLPREAISSDWLVSDVERINGIIQFTMILPHGADAPAEMRQPTFMEITEDGPISLPTQNKGFQA